MNTQTMRSIWAWTPILMFHEVLPDSVATLPPYAVTQSQLRRILGDFAERGYTSGTLEDVVYGPEPSRDQRHGHRKRLVLTFDDGTRDFIEYALPVLQEFNFSATLFVVAGMLGGKRMWGSLGGPPHCTEVPLLDRAEIRDLHAQGFTIGSHTISHSLLPSLSEDEVANEVNLSRYILSGLTGHPVKWFAYPYLAADQKTVALVRKAGYTGACGGPNRRHEQYYLNRINAPDFSLPELRVRCNGLYHFTRQVMRRMPSAASW